MSDHKYSVPDDHWESDDEEPEPEPDHPTTTVQSHDVEVVHTDDPGHQYAEMGYGRTKYTVRVTHDEGDVNALYAIEHKWKGNYWRDVREIDWREVPTPVKEHVADVVDCESVNDLAPSVRLIEEGGESTWTNNTGDTDATE